MDITCVPISSSPIHHSYYNNTRQGNQESPRFLNMTITELRVHMDCAGCETKIKKALKKIRGVDDVYTDVFMQKVTVMGWADKKKVLKTVRKTGKRAELWPYPYNPEYDNYNTQQYYYHQNQNMTSEPNIMTFYRAPQAQPSSKYNYYKHGYDNGDDYGRYQPPLYSSIIDEQASAVFSDDNPNACSIM
ncbi:heavy metal-associated isoprenylated plant protein 26-like [Tripterygium wilfordii]|uniref:Heavy metal-associated isoprenylated plant protein 26-like n=1 Tax=Tripterygium wilfordii TaxID=458696 RepID=A0A7J7D7W3_TRIWF|nr:heavy metal-associated isoprenylated plant protein 28-like [Tripterygium wilfordii]KAF5742339.1 heavy metal-associated isoprenylated plant protein 26-like [Tripterygium wilfordii]